MDKTLFARIKTSINIYVNQHIPIIAFMWDNDVLVRRYLHRLDKTRSGNYMYKGIPLDEEDLKDISEYLNERIDKRREKEKDNIDRLFNKIMDEQEEKIKDQEWRDFCFKIESGKLESHEVEVALEYIIEQYQDNEISEYTFIFIVESISNALFRFQKDKER